MVGGEAEGGHVGSLPPTEHRQGEALEQRGGQVLALLIAPQEDVQVGQQEVWGGCQLEALVERSGPAGPEAGVVVLQADVMMEALYLPLPPPLLPGPGQGEGGEAEQLVEAALPPVEGCQHIDLLHKAGVGVLKDQVQDGLRGGLGEVQGVLEGVAALEEDAVHVLPTAVRPGTLQNLVQALQEGQGLVQLASSPHPGPL